MDQLEDPRDLERKIEQASRIASRVIDQTTYQRLTAWGDKLRQKLQKPCCKEMKVYGHSAGVIASSRIDKCSQCEDPHAFSFSPGFLPTLALIDRREELLAGKNVGGFGSAAAADNRPMHVVCGSVQNTRKGPRISARRSTSLLSIHVVGRY
ncbi:hypothetical protein [Bradyrhizobium sp. OAE829]|uniref:hypothetical protein n=1 Tax=Bradyrhizobium sp. OAE829 TaxID=2663807 RepID=UPI00178A7F2F